MTEQQTAPAPSGALERHRGPHGLAVPVMTLEERLVYAERLAWASLLPAQYRQAPANVLVAMEFGDALGIPPIQAINSIHVIEGKPTASADLLAALIRRAGHKLRVSGDDHSSTAQIVRWDDPEFTFEVTWTIEKARAAQLLGKRGDMWTKYPAAMLRSRAITEVARMAASDALYGVKYTPEELGAVVNEEGSPVEYVSAETPRPQAAPPAPAAGQEAPVVNPEPEAPQEAAQPPQGAPPAPAEDVADAEVPEEPPAAPDAPETPAAAALRLAAAGDPQSAVRAAWNDVSALTDLNEWILTNQPGARAFLDLITARIKSIQENNA